MTERMRESVLADALLNLAERRNLELAYAPELIAGKTSDCPSLPEEDEAALECVLEASGLVAKKLNSGVFVIQQPVESGSSYTGGIVGRVRNYDSGALLAGAHIIVDGTPYSTASSEAGAFFIDRMPPGLYDVCVSMMGYASMCFRQIHVIAGQQIDVELLLEEATWPLEEVLVTTSKDRMRISLPDSLDPLAYQGLHIGSVSAGLFLSSRPDKVKGVQLSGLGSMARDSLQGVQFSGVFNSAANSSRGAQFGGIFNTIGGDLDGYQFSGVLNQLTGDLTGGQFAGTVNTAGYVKGAQFSGIANLADGDLDGVQGAGIANVAQHVDGAQLAGIANRSLQTTGLQGAGILNVSGPMRGWQLGGVANLVYGDFRGPQLSGVVNVAKDIDRGVQIAGVVNVVGNMERGLQLGLVNVARNNNGLPLGLVSYVHETGMRFDAWADETGMITTAIRTGNRKFSNYIGFGARPEENLPDKAYVFGLGGEFTFKPRFYGALDLFYYGFGWDSRTAPDEHLAKLRWIFGFKVTPHIALFGGPSLNLLIADQENSILSIPDRLDEGRWGSSYYDVWAGYAVGVRVLTKR